MKTFYELLLLNLARYKNLQITYELKKTLQRLIHDPLMDISLFLCQLL